MLSLSVEMFNAKWIIPSGDWVGDDSLTNMDGLHPEVIKFIMDMLSFSLEDHTGDSLMACWFAREGYRGGMCSSFSIDMNAR